MCYRVVLFWPKTKVAVVYQGIVTVLTSFFRSQDTVKETNLLVYNTTPLLSTCGLIFFCFCLEFLAPSKDCFWWHWFVNESIKYSTPLQVRVYVPTLRILSVTNPSLRIFPFRHLTYPFRFHSHYPRITKILFHRVYLTEFWCLQII